MFRTLVAALVAGTAASAAMAAVPADVTRNAPVLPVAARAIATAEAPAAILEARRGRGRGNDDRPGHDRNDDNGGRNGGQGADDGPNQDAGDDNGSGGGGADDGANRT